MLRSMRIATVLLGVALASAAHAEQVSLAADLEPGDSHSYLYTNKLSQQPTGKFAQNSSYVNYTLEFTATTKDVSEQYTDVQVVFSRIAIDSTLGKFDSSTPATEDKTNLVAQAFRPAIGAPFRVRLDTKTKHVIGIIGPDQGYVPDMMIRLYSRVLGENTLGESLQPIFCLKSDPATASPGDTWSRTLVRHANYGRIDIRLDFTLDDVKDDLANITIGGQHIMRLEQATPVSQRLTDQSVKGKATWNVADDIIQDYALTKTFTYAAGDEHFSFGGKVTEQEHLERTK